MADTPLMQQYRQIKSGHADAILFFRMGDFYEMFYDDAKLAAHELGLTLTTRNNGGAANVPLAGVPVKAATDYIRRLVQRGFRVAICEQVEDPKQAKGLVRREVVETVTPGAVLTEDLLDGAANNFLLAVAPGERIGLAALDLSTGEFFLETVDAEQIDGALSRYAPKELVLPEGLPDPTHGSPAMRSHREAWEFDPAHSSDLLRQRFALHSLDGLGIESEDAPAVGAAGALLRYAGTLQPSGTPQISRPEIRRGRDAVPLDTMTRRNLELTEPLRAGDRGSTLLVVLDRTVTPMGARLLRQWVLAPLRDVVAINARLDAVDTLVCDRRGCDRLRDGLDGVRDLERLGGRVAAGRGTPRDLGALRDSMQRLPDVQGALDGLTAREHSELLERLAHELDLLSDLSDLLGRMLNPRPPAAIGDGDTIRTGADPDLDEARDLRDGGKRFIAGIQARERERTKIPSLKIGYNKVFGYYIEISKSQKRAAPNEYERRQTLANAERYVTPELKDYEAKVLSAEERVLCRERELVDNLCTAVATRLNRLQNTARLVATVDVFCALAETAVGERYVRPMVTEEFALDLRGSRHPVVERMLPPGKFIPNDIVLDEAGRVVLLTGPNMAGKSTVLRQTGLTVLLAQVGSFVPAKTATIGVVDRIFTRVGASDDLGRGQSTFMVEMSETSAILNSATDRSLVLLDEIGRGTSTFDGVAIAWAVTEHLHDRVGCKTIFATHYHELTQLTEELQHARNFNVAVQETGNSVAFLYRLIPGGSDRSYGIHVGRLAGLPSNVVARAEEILHLLESGHHVAGAHPLLQPDAEQLTLFRSTDHPVLAALAHLDPDALSPIEALTRLADLKRQVEKP
jgi:DNA mismatch repair protein MutS